MTRSKGYTLIELIVAMGLFSLIMLLASGAYLILIGANRQAQAISTGIDNLSFALESMTRSIRTGTSYNCGGLGDCPNGANSFSLVDDSGTSVTYSLFGSTIQKMTGNTASTLTDPSVTISSLTFYAFGTHPAPTDYQQARVTIIVSGTVSSGPGKTEPFTIETGATMRGSDI